VVPINSDRPFPLVQLRKSASDILHVDNNKIRHIIYSLQRTIEKKKDPVQQRVVNKMSVEPKTSSGVMSGHEMKEN